MGAFATNTAKVEANSAEPEILELQTSTGHNYALGAPDDDDRMEKQAPTSLEPVGVAEVEAAQMVWGKHGKYILWAGLVHTMQYITLRWLMEGVVWH